MISFFKGNKISTPVTESRPTFRFTWRFSGWSSISTTSSKSLPSTSIGREVGVVRTFVVLVLIKVLIMILILILIIVLILVEGEINLNLFYKLK